MPLLTRKKVLTIDRNRTTSLPTTLGNTASAENIPLDATATLDAERIDRNFSTATLTALKDLTGQKAVDVSFGIELRGSNDGTSEPQWSKILDGCGLPAVAIKKIDISSGSGTLRHGETVTGGTSGATATVVMDTHEGTTELYVSDDTGTFQAAETITGTDSNSTATAGGAAAAEGYAWWPSSVVEKGILFDGAGLEDNLSPGDLIEGLTSGARGVVTQSATAGSSAIVSYTPVRGTFQGGETMQRINPNADTDIGDLESSTGESYTQFAPMGIRLYTDGKAITVNGSRGNVVFNFEVNRPVRMDYSFRGVLNDVDDAVLLSGIDYENVDPPLFESSTIGFAQNETAGEAQLADEQSPCIQTATFDIGNQITDRKCAGSPNGLEEVVISARDGSGSMTVEDTLESDIGFLSRINDNETVRLRMTVGSTDGNRFTIAAPGIQFTGHSEGDADGIVTQDMSFRLTGGNLFDLNTNTELNAIGGDNEFVMIYHTS